MEQQIRESNLNEGEPGWYPTFTPAPIARTVETDAQWENVTFWREHHARAMGLYLRTFQTLCAHLGAPKTCRIGKCRRRRDCLGRRDPDDWSYPLAPLIPPCVPLKEEIFQPLREEIMRELQRRCASDEEEENSPEFE